MEIRCLRNLSGVTHIDQVGNEKIHKRTNIMRELTGQADQGIL